MDRTTAYGCVTVNGVRQFQDENLLAGIDGTDWVAADATAHQEELMALILAGDLVGNAADLSQALRAVLRIGRRIEVFGASGSWTSPGYLTRPRVTLFGGGAAGGGGGGSSNYSGAGGGSGAYVRGYFDATPSTNYPIVVGAGGTGAAGNGNNGSSSSFGGTMMVAGGGQGGAGVGSPNAAGGAGGIGTGGDLVIPGGWGNDGNANTNDVGSGFGAGSKWAGGGRAGSGAGLPGTSPGAGGGGSYGISEAGAGGGGAGGMVIVEW